MKLYKLIQDIKSFQCFKNHPNQSFLQGGYDFVKFGQTLVQQAFWQPISATTFQL